MINSLPIILAIIGVFGLLFTLFLYMQWKKGTQSDVLASGSSFGKFNTDEYYQKAYASSLRIPLLKRVITSIRSRFETLAVYDEYRLRKEVMRIIFGLVTVLMFILLLLILIRPSFLVIFWSFVGIIFLVGLLMDLFVYRVVVKLLIQLKDFNGHVSSSYLETKMIDESIFMATALVGPEMRIQAEHIYRIMTSLEPEEDLAKYDEVAPIRYLKIVAGICLKVKDHGDVLYNNRSTFLAALSSINEEINADILFRQKLSQRLRGAAIIALVPIFFALPLQYVAIKMFPIMINFFDSRWGFLSSILAYSIALVSYVIVRKMGEINEAKYVASGRFKWEEWAIKNIPMLDRLVKGFTPTLNTKKYFQLTKLIKDANSYLKIEWLTLRQMVFSVSVVFLLIGGIWYSGERVVRTVLYSTLPQSSFTGKSTEKDYQIHQEITEFDRKVLADIKEMKTPPPEEIHALIAANLGLDIEDKEVKDAASRIIGKWDIVSNSFIKWWEVLLVIIVAAVVWHVPVWVLKFQRNMRMKDMENEVHQFIVIIIILRNFDRMSVYTMLQWMERFSIVFKEPIQSTLQLYDAGPEEALDYLNNEVSFEGLNQIVKRLKLCIVRVSIQEAFEDMDMEKDFYMEQRKEANFITLQKKGNLSFMFGMMPVVVLIFLYIIFPFVYMSITETQGLTP